MTCQACAGALAGHRTYGRFHRACLERLLRLRKNATT